MPLLQYTLKTITGYVKEKRGETGTMWNKMTVTLYFECL